VDLISGDLLRYFLVKSIQLRSNSPGSSYVVGVPRERLERGVWSHDVAGGSTIVFLGRHSQHIVRTVRLQ